MTPQRHKEICETFSATIELEPRDRSAFLDKQCGSDSDLRTEVESLLANHGAHTVSALRVSAVMTDDSARSTATHIMPGQRVNNYQILEVLGRGGMGVVYKAQQENPRRIVALKVINPGVVNAVMLKRFEQEARALGLLQHPGIAQIFEAVTYDAGGGAGPQPYFAMEFVEGVPLTDYASTAKLRTQQRLELMVKICHAVQHAHQMGVIHRDLKPGNILVAENGQPKILDFGIARVTDSDN